MIKKKMKINRKFIHELLKLINDLLFLKTSINVVEEIIKL